MVKRIENDSEPEPLRSLIGFCGIDCAECKAFVATKNDDAVMKKLVAEEWSKFYGHEMKPEDINCVGCVVVEGPHLGFCALCEIRNCGVQKKVENCAYCIEYGCGKLETVHSRSSKAKDALEQIRARKVQVKLQLVAKPTSVKTLTTVPFENGFHFYTAIGNYTGITAINLNEFVAKLQIIPIESVTFHFQRKDFQQWIKDTIKDEELAEQLNTVRQGLSAEELRKEILSTVRARAA